MSPLVAIAIAVIFFRALGFLHKYLPSGIPAVVFEPITDLAPLVLAGLLAWGEWYYGVAGAVFAIGLLNVLDLGRDALMMFYVSTVSGRRHR